MRIYTVWEDDGSSPTFYHTIGNNTGILTTGNSTKRLRVSVNNTSGIADATAFRWFMINLGETVEPYKPYGINNVYTTSVGKNLISTDQSNWTKVGAYYFLKLPDNATYVASVKKTSYSGNLFSIGFSKTTNVHDGYKWFVNNGVVQQSVNNTAVTGYSYLFVYIGSENWGVGFDGFEIQVERGTVATPYEPYKPAQTLTSHTPNGLPGIPVNDESIATYKDITGQLWVADEINYGTGEYVQRLYNLVFDGTESFFRAGTKQFGYVVTNRLLSTNYAASAKAKCSHFRYDSAAYGSNVTGFVTNYQNMYFTDLGMTSDNVETFKSFVQEQYTNGTPVTVSYILEEPIRTPLTQDEINAFKALNNPAGDVTVYSEGNIVVGLSEFAANSYTDKQIAQSQAASNAYADEQISQIQIGGRNLARNTASAKSHTVTDSDRASCSWNVCNLYWIHGILLEKGQTYTLSYNYEFDWGSVTKPTSASRIGAGIGTGSTIGYLEDTFAGCADYWTYGSGKYDSGKFVYTFTYDGKSSYKCFAFRMLRSYEYKTVGVKLTISNFKLEKGNKATDWTPAPEDIDNAIADSETRTENAMQDAIADSESRTNQNIDNAIADSETRTDLVIQGAVGESEDRLNQSIQEVSDAAAKKPVINGQNGQVVTIENALPDSIDGLKLYGKTTQFTTTGAQLAKFNDGTATQNGVTITAKDNIITTKGTPTNTSGYVLTLFSNDVDLSLLKIGTIYRCSSKCNINYIENGTSKYGSTFAFNENITAVAVYFQRSLNNYIDGDVIYAGLTTEENRGIFEPYTGGIASPNPDYPQELVNLGADGSLDTSITGRNLVSPLEINKSTNGVTFTANSDGSVTANGTATTNAYCIISDVKLFPNTYRLSGCPSGGASNKYALQTYFVKDDGSDGKTHANEFGEQGEVFTVTEMLKLRVMIVIRTGVTVNNLIFHPSIVLESQHDGLYEKGIPAQTITSQTPNGLPGIEVTDVSIATYTDADGKMWVCDEIDYGTVEYVQRVYKQIFTGEETINNLSTVGVETSAFHYNISDDARPLYSGSTAVKSICSHFVGATITSSGTQIGHQVRFASDLASARICFRPNGVSSMIIDDFKNLLRSQYSAGTPATVIYPLAEPIRTPLSSEELAAFKALGNPAGNVTVYSEADISVELSDSSSTKALTQQIDKVQNTIDQNAVAVENRFALTDELLSKLENMISMLVRDENNESLMTQTADGGWTFSMAQYNDLTSSLSESVSALQNATGSTDASVKILQDAVANLQESAEYVRITTDNDEPCIELGEGDSDFKLKITNTRIMFMDGNNVPTYIDTSGLVTENITISGELRQGNWVWKQRSNGNYGLQRKG